MRPESPGSGNTGRVCACVQVRCMCVRSLRISLGIFRVGLEEVDNRRVSSSVSSGGRNREARPVGPRQVESQCWRWGVLFGPQMSQMLEDLCLFPMPGCSQWRGSCRGMSQVGFLISVEQLRLSCVCVGFVCVCVYAEHICVCMCLRVSPLPLPCHSKQMQGVPHHPTPTPLPPRPSLRRKTRITHPPPVP